MTRASRRLPRTVALALAACSGGTATTPRSGSGSAPRQDLPVWRAGVGVAGCTLADSRETCEATYGEGVTDRQGHQITLYPQHGLGRFYDEPRVHIWYRSRFVERFRGTDPSGIGGDSTVADVERVYGPSEPYAPYFEETVIAYPDKGLRLGFVDGKLAHVMIETPWRSTATWPERKAVGLVHRFPKGWIVKPLGAPPGGGLVDHALIISRPVNRFPDEAPVGEWIRYEQYKPALAPIQRCDVPGRIHVMKSELAVCRSGGGGKPFEFTLTGDAGGMTFIFHFNSLEESPELAHLILGTFVLDAPP